MNTKFLELLRDKLKTVPRKEYDHTHWAGGQKRGIFCDTAACAAGHATTIPRIRRTGFRLAVRFNLYDGEQSQPYPFFKDKTNSRTYTSYDAIQVCFDLNRGQTMFIFASDHETKERTPKQTARRIQRVLDGKEIPSYA